MPINRSPQTAATASSSSAIKNSLQHSSSEPALNEDSLLTTESIYSSVTQRAKRMRPTDSQDNQDDKFLFVMTEMKSMFCEFKEHQKKQDERFEKLLEDIRIQNSDIRASLDFMTQKYDSFLIQIDQLEAERKSDKIHIEALELKLEKFECLSRSACLEIRNIPVNASETKPTLLKTVLSLGETLSVPIQPQEVKDVFRVKPKVPSTKRNIIVEFTSVLLKEKMVQNYKRFNKSYRLTTETLKISGPAVPVFVSENLSSKMKRLFYLAREFAKTNDYRYCWVSNGKIFLREKDGATQKRIQSEEDLEKLQNRQ